MNNGGFKIKKLLITLLSSYVVFLIILLMNPIYVFASAVATVSGETKDEAEIVIASEDTAHEFGKDGLTVSVDYGFNNKVKKQCYMPVNVTVKSDNTKFNGYIQIGVSESDGGTLYRREVIVEKGKSTEVLLNVPVNTSSGSMICYLLDSNETEIAKETLKIDVYNTDSVMVGMLSDKPDDVKYLTSDNQDVIVQLNKNTFPQNYKSLESLNLIIVNNYDTSQLSDTQYNALKSWINTGGMLVIGTGSSAKKTLARFNDDFLKVSIGKTNNIKISFSSGSKDDMQKNVLTNMNNQGYNIDEKSDVWTGFWKKYNASTFAPVDKPKEGSDQELQNYIYEYATREESSWVERNITNLTIGNGITVLNCDNNKLIQLVNKSKGKILVAEFDLSIEETYLEARKQLCEIIYKYDSASSSNKVEDYLSSILQSSRSKMPIASKYIKILLAYFLVMIGMYIILLKKAMRRYMWAIVPALSLVFCFIMFLMSSETRITKPHSTFFSVIKLGENGTASEDVYFNYLIPDNKEHEMVINGEYDLYSKIFSSEISEEETTGSSDYSVFIKDSDDSTDLLIKGLSTFSTKNFNASRMFETKSNYGVELGCFKNEYTGKFTNDTGKDLKYVCVITPNHVMYLGTVKNGDTVDLSGYDSISYNSKLDVCYAVYSLMGKDKDNAENSIDSNGNITSIGFARALQYYMLSNNFASNSSACMLGISDEKSEAVKNLEVESSGMSVYAKDFEIKYKNAEGQVYVPDIRNDLSIQEGETSYHTNEGATYIEGTTVESEYNLSSNEKMVSMIISGENNTVYKSEGTKNTIFDGTVSLWNYKTNKGYDVVYNAGEEVEITDFSKYINSYYNCLKIKFETSSEGTSCIPIISVVKTTK